MCGEMLRFREAQIGPRLSLSPQFSDSPKLCRKFHRKQLEANWFVAVRPFMGKNPCSVAQRRHRVNNAPVQNQTAANSSRLTRCSRVTILQVWPGVLEMLSPGGKTVASECKLCKPQSAQW